MAPPEKEANVKLSASDLCYATNDVELVRDVNLGLAPGVRVAVVGPNGAGKSTLLSLLSGDFRPSRGSITYDGMDVPTLPVRQLARSRAFLGQHQAENIAFNVRQIVEMSRYVYRNDASILPGDDQRAVASALKALDLGALENRLVSSLSGGERQRTAVARTIAQETPLILLDEPTTALDIGHQEMVIRVIRSLGRSGRTVVAVLHDLNMATAFDQVVLLDGGNVAAYGTPHEVLNSKGLTEVYEHPIEVVEHPLRPGILVLPYTEA
jgi:iron complex transport system ATP-binding protein